MIRDPMRVNSIIGYGATGLLLGLGIFYLDTSGYFERWEKLPNPTVEDVSFVSTEIPPPGHGPNSNKPCDFSTIEFSFVINPPKQIQKCVQVVYRAAEAYTNLTLIIDTNGNYWRWSHFSYAMEEFIKSIFYPICGLAFGLGIGLASLLRVAFKR
jgi:hypothetical protein